VLDDVLVTTSVNLPHQLRNLQMTSRRVFILQSVLGTGLLASGAAKAELPTLTEADAMAKTLGYVTESSKADMKKYPKHTNAQACANCALFQGKAGDAAGPCPLYPGKQVSVKGWCSGYAKKA
jgi:hypothetical protein